MATVGIFLGAGASYLSGKANSVSARYSGFEQIKRFELEDQASSGTQSKLREGSSHGGGGDHTGHSSGHSSGQFFGASGSWSQQQASSQWGDTLREGDLTDVSGRRKVVNEVLHGTSQIPTNGPDVSVQNKLVQRPRVVIIFDDMGPDQKAFRRIMDMPGPLTLSFLPYARNVQKQVDEAANLGHAVMLHLPMEPVGPQNPGPHALKVSSSSTAFRKDLNWNLDQFKGYKGVNNHMGSRLTADKKSMLRIMAAMKKRGLYFVDSVTTAKTVARDAASESGVTILSRDVFLDPEAGRQTVRRQLFQVEEIARRTGYAIAIAHPHPETLDMLGPWLASASLRGFELVTIENLVADTRTHGVKG